MDLHASYIQHVGGFNLFIQYALDVVCTLYLHSSSHHFIKGTHVKTIYNHHGESQIKGIDQVKLHHS